MTMRTRIWNHLANLKFKAIYCQKYSSLAGFWGGTFSVFLALTSTGSVAAWAIWNKYPFLWAIIVGLAQVLQLAKPHLPFLGADRDLLERSFEFERLYLDAECLWQDVEAERISDDKAERRLYASKNKVLEIEKEHRRTPCREFAFLIKKAEKETLSLLALDFPPQEEEYEQRETVYTREPTTTATA